MTIRTKRDHDLLSKQKPVRRRKKRLRRIDRRWLAAVPVVVLLGLLAHHLWPRAAKILTLVLFPAPVAGWQLLVTSSGNPPLTTDEQQSIITSIAESLGGGSPQELAKAAAHVLKDSPYDEVALVKTSPTTIHARVGKRAPSMLVLADALRFVSSQGTVYGLAKNDPAATAQGFAVLSGLFDERSAPYRFAANNSLELSDDEKTVIDEALVLQKHLQQEHLKLEGLTYKKYRGFFATLGDPQTDVAFGRAPFLDKMKKLKKVLAHLSSKGVYAAKIELDYEGKVFIKEKSI